MNSSAKKPINWSKKNPFEHDIRETSSNIRDLLSSRENFEENTDKPIGPINQEIFSFKSHHETKVIPQEIMQLKEEIRREIKQLKAVNSSVTTQISDIEKEIQELKAKEMPTPAPNRPSSDNSQRFFDEEE